MIYHILSKQTWLITQHLGIYETTSLKDQGFIHCSSEEQVLRVANTWYKEQDDLIVLEIDPAQLKPEVRWEPGVDKMDESFPHIYGRMNLDAVIRVLDLDKTPEGLFTWNNKIK